jgi:penicillin amidase
VGFQWYSVYRAARIKEVLEQAKASATKLTVADMQSLQNDVLSIPARELLSLLRQAVAGSSNSSAQLLLSWDAKVTRESAAAALYELWMLDLNTAVLRRAAPENTWTIVKELAPNQMIKILTEASPSVFGADPVSARNQVLMDSLKSATERLTKLEGPDPGKWSWQQLHVISFRHPLDGVKDTTFMNLGPLPRPGDGETVNSTEFDASFAQISGASYREVLDTSDWDKSVAVNVPGQSGQPGSIHYSDLLPLWGEGKYFPMSYSKAAVQKNATHRLILEP